MFEIKKGKLKTKKLLKITMMSKSPQYNQQSKSEVEEICIYHPKHGKWPSQHLYLKIDT